MFKDAISVPGLTLKYLFQALSCKSFSHCSNSRIATSTTKFANKLLIFHRYHESGVTRIRNGDKMCVMKYSALTPCSLPVVPHYTILSADECLQEIRRVQVLVLSSGITLAQVINLSLPENQLIGIWLVVGLLDPNSPTSVYPATYPSTFYFYIIHCIGPCRSW